MSIIDAVAIAANIKPQAVSSVFAFIFKLN